MAQSLKEQLIRKVELPEPGNIRYVDDNGVRLSDEQREFKHDRLVIVVSVANLITDRSKIINIIPCSTSVPFDNLNFPIHQGMINKKDRFRAKTSSCACLQFYQPLHFEYLGKKVAELNDITYLGVLSSLANNVIGISEGYDLEID